MSGVPRSPARQRLIVEEVEASAFRDACARALADGERFCGAYADAEGRWTALFARDATTRAVRTRTSGVIDSILELAPGANWDEREAHDSFGLRFPGHEPLRPLLAHDAELEEWTVPVHGDGTHQVAVGPIHAGVIESGHFRFHVLGERILLVDLRLFYKRRGLEAAAEGQPLAAARAYAQRACGVCAVTNSVAFAQATESLQGLAPSPAVRRARTVLLELERVYNHLHDIGAICAGVGFAAGQMAFGALQERAQRLNDRLTGHRFLFGTVSPGESGFALAGAELDHARGALRELRADAARAWRELEFTTPLQARVNGVGVLLADDARRLGAVGPAARAGGLGVDARGESPGLWYGGFQPARLSDSSGDVGARFRIRALELEQSFEILDELLGEPIEPGTCEPAGPAEPLGIARVESPRGETVCAVEAADGRVRRLHLRTGSYANWPALAHATAGEILPEFPLINKSFELCYACVDR